MEAYKQTVTKKEFLKELKWHQKADAFAKGRYWGRDQKGCAVGCSLNSVMRAKGLKLQHSDHSLYPAHLGIPEWLAHVEDTIFEGVSVERSKTWPVEFAQAINTGADLEKAKAPFMICVLESTLNIKEVKEDLTVLKSIKDVIALWKKYPAGPDAAWSAARSAAESAAESAARSAARSAAWSAARSAAESAAESAAWSAARSAAWSAARSAAESAARSAAESAAYEYFADELIEILKKCK